MNCKPGNLAMIVRHYRKENNGKIVKCLRFIGEVEFFEHADRWEIDNVIVSKHGRKINHISDSMLLPIRPDETPEESLEAMRVLTQIPQEEKV